MSKLVAPHGSGELKPLLLEGKARQEELKKAEGLRKVPMTTRETGDLIMMGIGAFTPLDGFMGKADWQGCCDTYQHAEQEGTVLAHPDHAVGGEEPGRLARDRARKWRSGTPRPKRSWAP